MSAKIIDVQLPFNEVKKITNIKINNKIFDYFGLVKIDENGNKIPNGVGYLLLKPKQEKR